MVKRYVLANKATAASLHFQVVCEEDLDEVLKKTSTFILKQLNYSLLISMRDS